VLYLGATKTRAPSGEEDGVFGEFHRDFVDLRFMDKLIQAVK
jgi:hypothetical protein